MNTSNRLIRLGSGVFARNDLRKEVYQNSRLRKKSLPLVDLSLGSTDLLPPDNVLKAIRESTFDPYSSSYCLHAATRSFREHVAEWVERRFQINVDPDKEVLLLIGSQEGTAHLPLSVINPGERGLILDPSYPSHAGGLILSDAQIQRLQICFENGWKPDFNSITQSQLDQLKLMIFGFPHNPTAQVGDQSWLEEAMTLGVKNQIVIAHDNPYFDLALEGNTPALLNCSGWREWGIEFFSFSKAWCLGGFRLGFAIGAESLIRGLKSVKGVIDFNQSLALQKGAITALKDSSTWPEKLLEIYKERRDRTFRLLSQLGWHVPIPSMALYFWMPLPPWAIARNWDDEKFVDQLLNDTGVALTPGSGFGLGGKNWIRMALVRPSDELDEAINRLFPWWNENS